MFYNFYRRYNFHHQKFNMVLHTGFSKMIFMVLIVLLMTACGVSRPGVQSDRTVSNRDIRSENRLVAGSVPVIQKLNSAHGEWEGTPYVLGGSSINGIDCSAFTKIVFEDYFEITIPRHTSEQIQAGNGVRRNYIQPGDLVFFRTAKGVLHVGIAMEDDRFLHASVSSGVMISSLRERYWANRYLGTRRVL